MCGITGFIDFNRKTDAMVLQQMNSTLKHRGPDGQAQVLLSTDNATIGLAHSRLSIIDLSSGGTQPMHLPARANLDGGPVGLTIVFNGEMYNHEEIKRSLELLGHNFQSSSDTEVILHAFQQWGVDCIHKFIGMFAIFIFDAAKNEVYLIRDRAGVKPLFYYYHNNLFLFGSELKALVAHPLFEKQIEHDAISLFLQYGYVPNPHCIYKYTTKLQPGHYIKIDLQKPEFNQEQYWNVYDAYNKPKLDIDYQTAKVETEKLLQSACDYRMVSDVPVGVFLSGGYDSTAVTALLQKESTQKIKTFTIGFNDEKLNEAQYAKQVATHLGTEHTEYYCTIKEALDIVPQLPFFYDEPFADSSAIPTTLVSKVARKSVTVALSADAGDEVFAGYNRYDYIMTFGKKIKRIPLPIRKLVAGAMNIIPADSIPILRDKYLFHSRYEKVKQFLNQADDFNMNQVLSKQFLPEDIDKLLLGKTTVLSTAFDNSQLKAEHYSTLNYIMAIDYQTYLVDDILQKVDRATMTHSLEGREPFLDHRVIEWAAQLPTEYKYNKGVKKLILKDIVHQYVPKEVMDRPKMGFGIPIEDWLTKDLKYLVDEFFSTQYLTKQKIFDVQATQKVIAAFYNGKKERSAKIWYLLMFQMWYNHWIK
jgi:asparagine synthase (glutamine-hydrolysing)